ncbi:GNAT family N-acetyltransferase [Paenibacillus sp. J5C_2022]|uniref:GNAT family N-acetyltransferase n=1 Tax=Paenibacillus sp. J5C2022 TaxID=2977129 RepID=UPI0021D37FA1|nr:GNAT family N-acetyltransferase [Paenibacillus sp. J5C2022]MCU6712924.1 GNAT family N-acetyltransferase [Paenibacillus sp. J5C2022]
MIIREAREEDIDALIMMRWEFTLEYQSDVSDHYELFATECRVFLEQALRGDRWHIWVAEMEGVIASHVYIQLIDKVPRPGRITYPFAYMTNVYTDPAYRSQGVGSQLLKAIQGWAVESKFEFIIVWPSEESREFYVRNGYKLCNDPMDLHL